MLCLSLSLLARAASARVLAADQTWSGTVRVEEDLLVPRGITLRVAAGTRIVVAPAESTKTDPVFWNPATEIAVEGRLEVMGTAAAPVAFEGEEGAKWGGIVSAPGGSVSLLNASIRGAQESLLCVGSLCVVRDVEVVGGEYGLVLGPGAAMEATHVSVLDCRVGLLDLRDSSHGSRKGVDIRRPEDAATLALPGPPRRWSSALPRVVQGPRVELVGDSTVEKSESWKGEVIVSGRVTVVPGAVLTLEPGTRVAFRKRDTNGDGLGEGELLVLGGIRTLGTSSMPVFFESAEQDPKPGDWDKVSLIDSEDPVNAFRYTVFRYGTQALHAHFSSFSASDCFFESNLRAVQFQESGFARLERNVFWNNKQALRFRDSRARVVGNIFAGNLYAVHAYRTEMFFGGNTLEANALGGFFAKESQLVFEGNRLFGNRDGLRAKDPGSRLEVRRNRIEASAENALALSQVQEGVVEENVLDGAGLDLVGLEESEVAVRANSFGRAGRDALHLKGSVDVDAAGNDWGTMAPPKRIHDREDDPAAGMARWNPPAGSELRIRVPSREW